jgi:hypothetical protein
MCFYFLLELVQFLHHENLNHCLNYFYSEFFLNFVSPLCNQCNHIYSI